MADITEGRTERCSLCDETAATVSYEIQEFNYGPIGDCVVLSARVPVVKCNACGESYLAEEAEEIMHDAVCAHLGRLTPAEVKAIRVGFGMRQEEFANFTKYGVASIKRWESGAQIQSDSADAHLRLLKSLGVTETLKRTTRRGESEFTRDFDEPTRDLARQFQLRAPVYAEPERMAA